MTRRRDRHTHGHRPRSGHYNAYDLVVSWPTNSWHYFDSLLRRALSQDRYDTHTPDEVAAIKLRNQ